MTQALTLVHRRLLSRRVYIALQVALVVAEFPFNLSVLQIFALPKQETTIMATGIGVALVAMAQGRPGRRLPIQRTLRHDQRIEGF